MNDRWLCGWRVATGIPLPDLLPWTGDDRAADLAIVLGEAPKVLPDLAHSSPLLQVSASGSCRFSVPGVATYLVEDGKRVTIDTRLDPTAPDIRVFLLGTVFGILCHQRGLLPLHASCVRIGDKAIAFGGPSGVGKSTLAAAFFRRGHEVLADDVTVVDTMAPGGPVVLPAFPRLKLWRDTMTSFALPTEGLEQSRADLQKFHLQVESSFATMPLALGAVYNLHEARDSRQHGSEISRGIAAIRETHDNVYRVRMASRLNKYEALFGSVSRLCSAVPVVRLARLRGLSHVDEAAAAIAESCS